MNKSDAAQYLEIGVRSLERYTAQGRISVKHVPGKTGAMADYDAGELQRFKAELASPQRSATRPPIVATPPKSARSARSANLLARVLAEAPPKLARVETTPPTLAKVAPDVRQVAEKLLWTLDEAALLTGLSRGRLRAAIEAKELKAGRVGRAFRVRPADVKKWIETLF